MLWRFNTLPKGKLSSEMILIFINSLPYSLGLPLIVLTYSLILFQSAVYFVNTSLFLLLETIVKYLFTMFSSVYPSILSMIKYKGFTLWIFT